MSIERDLFLGIDPGQAGGFGIVDSKGRLVDISKMPETEHDVADYLREFGPRVKMATIEKVHSMPKQGVSSSFKFGMSYGALRMALVALLIPFEGVSPIVWQKTLQCLSGGDKNKTKAKAQELFPGFKITHATADALLLAEHCRRAHIQRPQPNIFEPEMARTETR